MASKSKRSKKAVEGSAVAGAGAQTELVATAEGAAPEIPVLSELPTFGEPTAVVPVLEVKEEDKEKPAPVKPPRVVPENFTGTEVGKRCAVKYPWLNWGRLLRNVAELVASGEVAGELNDGDGKVHVAMTDDIVDKANKLYLDFVASETAKKTEKQERKNGGKRQSGVAAKRSDPLALARQILGNALRSLQFFMDKNRGLDLSSQKAELDVIQEQLIFGNDADPSATIAKIKAIVAKMDELATNHLAERVRTKLQRSADDLASTFIQRTDLDIRKIEEAFASGSTKSSEARRDLLEILMARIPRAIDVYRHSSPIPQTRRGERRDDKQNRSGQYRGRR
ncbi:MAG: hypothetical protein Q8P49_03850 [Candidatus Liptonbacteria bacterium]|nr:hypothetical protein [Candidatus Liptonbacteria bacterium]